MNVCSAQIMLENVCIRWCPLRNLQFLNEIASLKWTLFRVSTSVRKVIVTSVAAVFCWDFLYAHLTAALPSAFGILGKTDLTSDETISEFFGMLESFT